MVDQRISQSSSKWGHTNLLVVNVPEDELHIVTDRHHTRDTPGDILRERKLVTFKALLADHRRDHTRAFRNIDNPIIANPREDLLEEELGAVQLLYHEHVGGAEDVFEVFDLTVAYLRVEVEKPAAVKGLDAQRNFKLIRVTRARKPPNPLQLSRSTPF